MDIEKRISRLLSHISKMNKLEEASEKKVGDLLNEGNNLHRIIFISRSSNANEKGYFLVDTDWEELSDVCVNLSKTNPNIVAPEDVKRRLTELILEMKKNNWSKRGIQPKITKVIQLVKKYKGEDALITVPVWGLDLGDSSLIVGDVEFKSRPFPVGVEDEAIILDPKGIGINAIAITSSTGDRATIFANAKAKINRAINIIRAFSFPITRNIILQEISIEGDFRSLRSFGLLNYTADSKKSVAYTSSLYDVSIGGVIPFEVDKYSDLMNLRGFNELLKIMNNTDDFSKRIIKSADWLGEATKPDVLPSKFIKVAFSIDAMIGEDAPDIPDKGKRARIAERAAFLLGHGYKARKYVFDKLHNIIKNRDEIAHGGSKKIITEVDVEEAGKYARALLLTLLSREPKFKGIGQLAEWVKKQSLLG